MTTSLFSLASRVAIITGSSRGIGLAIARQFLLHGASVVVSGLDEDETRSACASLSRAYGSRVVALPGDVASPTFGPALISLAESEFGAVDIVVCNAGIDVIKPAIAYDPADWTRILDVNLRGAFLLAQAAGRHWIDTCQTDKVVVMTSSIAARAGIAGLAPYSASKAGLEQLVRSLAIEWATHGIRVNAVAPGYVENIMSGVTAHMDPASDAQIRSRTPLGRRGTLDEVAAPFVFLASPAASYVTGAVIAVDGGYAAA